MNTILPSALSSVAWVRTVTVWPSRASGRSPGETARSTQTWARFTTL